VADKGSPAALRRAKIVATVGPATDDLEVLTQMMHAGVDVVRLNASHGTIDDRRRRLALVRAAAQRADRCVGVLLDLAGPKIRIVSAKGGSCCWRGRPSRWIPSSIPRPARSRASVSPTRTCRAMYRPATRCC
jgi:hypothetical protein